MNVIKRKNLPVKLPLNSTAIAYLLLDKFNSPGIVWGIAGTFCVLLWIIYIAIIVKEKEIDLFKGDELKNK